MFSRGAATPATDFLQRRLTINAFRRHGLAKTTDITMMVKQFYETVSFEVAQDHGRVVAGTDIALRVDGEIGVFHATFE